MKDSNAQKKIRLGSIEIPMKYVSLFVLVFITSCTILLVRASRVNANYIPGTAILLAETLKLFFSYLLLIRENGAKTSSILYTEIWQRKSETIKLAIPAMLYVFQNNLLFVALSKLDAATYQVTYQLKILTTAGFAVLLLSKKLSSRQWTALIILTIGVAFVQYNNPLADNNTESSLDNDISSDFINIAINDQFVGLVCLITACFTSGLAGIYLEKVIKTTTSSIWIKNIQLSLFSILPALFYVLWNDTERVMTEGFFTGYTPLVMITILCHSSNGIVVAFVLKYADNILKTFATSISIVVSSIVSMVLFTFYPSIFWSFGCFLVIIATYFYSSGPSPKKPDILPISQNNTNN
eukprot:TRINITY_DN929_c0_g1_i1.p1 TRINITY_DN929_c0_g1~~TRINITY_DN929_c0_g1_i1.p1  ORF type:complete len:353 (-),score=52.04 TRINITY_DN929_c0_g1_i1:145-1203(-)